VTRAGDRSGEIDRIAKIASAFGALREADAANGIARGIGDDAAVIDSSARAGKIVWTIDAQVEGVHFRTDLASWEDVGWRSFMAAASDVAAMGASPWCALSALVLSDAIDDAALAAITRGQADAAREVGARVVGGNLSRGTETSITTTLLGTCERAIERCARGADGLWIAGEVGLAAAGLASLERRFDEHDADVARAVTAWRRPRARIAEGLAMAGVARGAIDVSDGLARDVSHVARASGLCAVIDERALGGHLHPALAAIASRLGVSSLDLALHGGEDYALLAVSDAPIEGFTRIGRFDSGEGVAIEDASGRRAVDPGGFDHFRSSR
jgi:thiamine-monophosphate kinase